MTANTIDKLKGIFFGQAIGDALGLGTEFLNKQEVDFHYPIGLDNYSQIIQDKHRSRWPKGNWTDDTDQFICILNSLIHCKQVKVLDIAKNFKQWLANDGMGIGSNTYRVLTLPQYELFPYKAAALIWKTRKKQSAPNGALMRNSIVCTFDFWSADSVLENCKVVCQLTHFDPRCVDSCQIMAKLIIGELNNKPLTWQNIQSEFIQHDERISLYIHTINVPIANLKLDESEALGYTLKALYAGMWSYYNASSFEAGIQTIIMEGGDADTNACIAGSLLGAKFGFNQIPKHLIDGLNQGKELESMFEEYIDLLKQRYLI